MNREEHTGVRNVTINMASSYISEVSKLTFSNCLLLYHRDLAGIFPEVNTFSSIPSSLIVSPQTTG